MQKEYGQFCPLAKAAELLCERWTMLVVRELTAGSRQFNDLQRGVPLMSPTLLSRRLKQLLDAGVIQKVAGERGRHLYELTTAGHELEPLVKMMGVWGHRWVGSRFEDEDLDVGLLMWDIRRGVKSDCFPSNRVVVEFTFTDGPKGMRQWWLVSEAGTVDLCLENPGHEVDLVISSTVKALTSVWMSGMSMQDAVTQGEIVVLGPVNLRQLLTSWLQGSPLARLGAESLNVNPVIEQQE